MSKYPRCSDIHTLESLPDGTIVYLRGWTISRTANTWFHLMDNLGGTIKLLGASISLGPVFNSRGADTLYGFDIHVRIERPEEIYTPFGWNRSSLEVYLYEPKPGKCDCGAVHTSFPSGHSAWCGSHILE